MPLQFSLRKHTFQILLFAIFCAVLILFIPSISKAQIVGSSMTQQINAFAGPNGAGFGAASDPRAIVVKVIRAFLSILGILFLVYAVYAGYLIMSSGGEEEKIRKGKSTLLTAMIGVLVIFSVYSILYFVLSLFQARVRERAILDIGIDRNGAYIQTR